MPKTLHDTRTVAPARTRAAPAGRGGGGTTPVPNALLDRWMPSLRDTELRVLLVVCRATRGFRAPAGDPAAPPASGARKARDWISHRQMVARTGRASAAVSRAVDVLVRRGLVAVEDGAGTPLPTASERRRCLGRLYYRLGERVGSGDGEADASGRGRRLSTDDGAWGDTCG